jgi:hypothetical protein
MKNKVSIDAPLGDVFPNKKATGFMRKYLVTDFTKAKSVVMVFCKEVAGLPASGELTVDCQEFCFVSK